MAPLDHFVSAARQCLRVGKKPLSVPRSRDLAALVKAVDLGLKSALLYDSNAAPVEQVQTYLSTLQREQLVSKSLQTVAIDEHILIVNRTLTIAHLEQLSTKKTVAVMDVCHSLDQPVITDLRRGDVENMIQALLSRLKEFGQTVDSPLCIGDFSETWNLCTLFGILLGYPATYWFDHIKSFENCLTMTPLVVTKALATWQVGTESHGCCLYSFSIPAVLEAETQSVLDEWTSRLQERFRQQTIFSGLDLSRTTVILPSVTL